MNLTVIVIGSPRARLGSLANEIVPEAALKVEMPVGMDSVSVKVIALQVLGSSRSCTYVVSNKVASVN